MKTNLILIIIATLLCASTCDKKTTMVASYKDEFQFSVNEIGNFGVKEEIITPGDVTESVESESINSVDIESIAIKYKKYADNDATSVIADGTADNKPVFTNYTVNLTENENEWIYITDQLNDTGVSHLKDTFKDYINGITTENIVLKIVDKSTNAGKKVHIEIYLKITAGIVFEE